jgi:hypothetical protein
MGGRFMVRAKGFSSTSISNLSFSLIESAFLLLTERALPVYRYNINRQRPPVAGGENVNAAASIVMLATGLDYHLCRLKYLRDVAIHNPPLPHTPYFDWTFGDSLSWKVAKLFKKAAEKRLMTQVIEMTVCRDSIVHPKFYTVTHSWDADFNDKRLAAKLSPGITLGNKAIAHKMRRRDFTRMLRLPIVPTWISYVDAVVCILVLHRVLNLLEWRYGNSYAWVGGITAYQKQTKELFTEWNWVRSHPRDLQDWTKAFFQSLSDEDQRKVKNRLGGRLDPYLKKKRPRIRLRSGAKYTLTDILQARRNPPKPEFLYKPPPW